MVNNTGRTSLKSRRSRNPMREFDRLPAELRCWLGTALLPWGPRSAKRAFEKAIRRTQDPALALQELDKIEARLVAKDARSIWGPDHPASG